MATNTGTVINTSTPVTSSFVEGQSTVRSPLLTAVTMHIGHVG